MKKTYVQILENKEEERIIDTGNRKIVIKYNHFPNVVGPRSKYTGLPIWVGMTIANSTSNGKLIEVVAKCWTDEPFNYDQARFIVTGRLLKELGQPTNLAEQVK